MIKEIIKTDKRHYLTPTVESVQLDNEISLALASAPPHSGDEVNLTPKYLSNNPFRTDNA
jgi:hypothetical protein